MTTRVGWQRDRDDQGALLSREWLITNGLGGYASGTIGGAPTRRYHGLLVAALPQPLGRTLMLNQLSERVVLPDGKAFELGGYERGERLELFGARHLLEFRLEQGLPVWTFELDVYVLEKRLLFAHLQNTVYVQYRILSGEGDVQLSLRPALHFRPHDDAVGVGLGSPYALTVRRAAALRKLGESLSSFAFGGTCRSPSDATVPSQTLHQGVKSASGVADGLE